MGLTNILKALPVIGTAVGIGESIFNGISQGRTNKKNQAFSREMYDRQRKDALADTAMQNEYNSPAATMARLKAAGLNPNLAYGSGATTQSAAVRSSSVESARAEAPKADSSAAINGFMAMYDIQKKQAETNNLNALANVARQEEINKITQRGHLEAGIRSLDANTENTKFHTGQARALNENTLEAARLANLKLQADTKYTLDNNERQIVLTNQSVVKSIEEILTMQAERKNIPVIRDKMLQEIQRLKSSGLLDDMEAELRRNGGSWHDSYAFRIIPFLKSKLDPAGSSNDDTVQPFKLQGAVKGIIQNLKRKK